MKRRRILWVTGLLVLLAFAANFFLSQGGPAEPSYKGKRLSKWLRELDDMYSSQGPPPQGQNPERAHAALSALGTNALPWLMHEFNRPPSRWRGAFNRWADRHPSWRFRFTADLKRFNRAGMGLQRLGPAVAPALPQLSECLGDPYRRIIAATAMANAGTPAVPYFLQAMGSTNPLVRAAATSGMVFACRDQEAVVAPVVAAMRSTNTAVRRFAGLHLSDLRFRPELTIPAFAEAVSDPDLEIRRHATNMMREIWENPHRFETGLRNLLQSTNAAKALAASNALFILKRP